MPNKIIVSIQGSLPKDSLDKRKQAVADLLCVCPEDIILLTDGLTVSVVDLPDELCKAREKADKEAEKEAAKAKEEQEAAELEAIKAATEKAQAEAKANAPEPVDYDSWTLADLHEEATKRDIHGRSGLDKAGLVKALRKSDKG